LAETLVAHPLCVDLLSQEMKRCLRKTSADPVEPEVATRLTQDGLIIVMDLFVTDATRIYWRSIGILWIENHWLVNWVNLL